MFSPGILHLFFRAIQTLALFAILQAVRYAYDLARKLRKPSDLPVLNLDGWKFDQAKDRYIKNLAHYIERGREEFPDQAIQLYGPEGYVVVVPERFVPELKALRDDIQDNLPLWTDILSDYVFVDVKLGPSMRKMISTKLTSKLDELIPDLVDEIRYSITENIPPTQDWTLVNVNEKLLRIVSLISGRIFVGQPTNRDEEWIETNNTFTEDIYGAGMVLKRKWYITKVITVMFSLIPELQRVKNRNATAHRLFKPEIQRRQRLLEKDPRTELPNDAITWILNMSATEVPSLTYEQQAEMQLLMSMAAIHTSRSTLTNALYDLVAHPQYIKPLREEIDSAWEASDEIDKTFAGKLILLDSFVKESQRLAPVGQLAFDRRVVSRKGITLSNGLHLRQGAHIAVAAYQLGLDPKVWDNPTEFHGFRFSHLRASPENANKFQFASTDPSNSLYFGYGNHDCPGRFFASVEIKLILAFVLRHYDLKASPDCIERPKTLMWAQRMSPDPSFRILMRKRIG